MEAKPRRFTGRQLMVMFIALCATAVLVPTALWAASTGSAVNIVDGTTATNKAGVEASGRLKVDAGLPTLFGLVPTYSGGGSVTQAYPTSAMVRSNDGSGDAVIIADNSCSSGTCKTLMAPAAGQAVVITSIHVNTLVDTTPGPSDFFGLDRSSDGTCHPASLDDGMEEVTPPTVGVTDLEYSVPGAMIIPAGTALCIFDSDPAHLQAAVTAWGYSVPSAAVPASAVAHGTPKGAALLTRKP